MDLAIEKIKAILRKSREGYRKLKPNEFRESNCAQAYKILRKLVYDKIMPEFEWNIENPREGIEYTVRNGVYSVPRSIGTAVVGTLIHEFYEKYLSHIPGIVHEELVTRERNGIIRSGHVDRRYPGLHGFTVNDVKSTNEGVIWSITKGPKPGGYTEKKVAKAVSQVNSYTIAVDAWDFNISYDAREDLTFRIDHYIDHSNSEDDYIWESLETVLEHIKNGTLPDTCDGMCDLPRGKQYCRHHHEYPDVDKSGANCPGRLRLQEIRENRKLDDDYDG